MPPNHDAWGCCGDQICPNQTQNQPGLHRQARLRTCHPRLAPTRRTPARLRRRDRPRHRRSPRTLLQHRQLLGPLPPAPLRHQHHHLRTRPPLPSLAARQAPVLLRQPPHPHPPRPARRRRYRARPPRRLLGRHAHLHHVLDDRPLPRHRTARDRRLHPRRHPRPDPATSATPSSPTSSASLD